MNQRAKTMCVVGLGYVGLPLAHALAKAGYKTFGYDVQQSRVQELQQGHDRTGELTTEQLQAVTLQVSNDPSIIAQADIIFVAVPTPIDSANKPDLTILKSASTTVGQNLKSGAIIVFESTVYPGTTEEICALILEQESGLKAGVDFTLGYSPERINPGDKLNTIDKIIKVVSGQNEPTLQVLSEVYGSIVTAGIHQAPSLKVAEMAKAIENAQRDLNIAFMNEVALLCSRLGIRTCDVLAAAGTKWNFLKFQPGLVGGHCIGVDPYYLVEKAEQLGMKTHVITAGRAVNDRMSRFVAKQIIATLPTMPSEARILIMGVTFKENVPDTRNSKVIDVITELTQHGCQVQVLDPHADQQFFTRHQLQLGSLSQQYHAVALLVPHHRFTQLQTHQLQQALLPNGLFYDLKSLYQPSDFTSQGFRYLSL